MHHRKDMFNSNYAKDKGKLKVRVKNHASFGRVPTSEDNINR